MKTGIWLLLLHIICCILVYIGIRTRILRVKLPMMAFVIFVPVTGLLCCLILHFQLFLKEGNRGIPGIEKMKIQEAIYRSIMTEGRESQGRIIPLEDALIVNDSAVRKNLMMEVLTDHPEAYMELLQMARMNEDVEVVHYATTALAEISKKYDRQLNRLETKWRDSKGEPGILEEYLSFLKQYLQQGIADGHMERIWREKYSSLLRQQITYLKELDVYRELVENEMELGHFPEARGILEDMEQWWEMEEDYQMELISYFIRTGQGEALQKQIRTIQEKKIYISRSNREKLNFWRIEHDKQGASAVEKVSV